MNIENAKTLFFTDKEHYLNFRKAWATAVNSPKAKSHLEPCNEWIEPTGLSRRTGKQRVRGWIDRRHVILYNLLREKDMEHGFTLVSNRNKLDNGMEVNHSLYYGTYELIAICEHAKCVGDAVVSPWRIKELAKLLEPFNGTITPEMLGKLKIPRLTLSYNKTFYSKAA